MKLLIMSTLALAIAGVGYAVWPDYTNVTSLGKA
jgi:hypothetical protein